MSGRRDRPPTWVAALLRLVRDPERRELLEGDLEEGYRARLRAGRVGAARWYTSQVVRSVVWSGRAAASGTLVDGVAVDVRDAWRGLRSRPGFVAVVVATLGLGLGVNTAMLAVADAVLFRPLPYPDPDRLLWIHAAGSDPSARFGQLTFQDVERLREADVGLSSVGAYSSAGRTVRAEGMEPLELDFARVTAGFLESLGVRMRLGRTFTSEELDDGLPVLVLTHAFWIERFGGDPGVLGREVRIRGEAHSVVGVAEPTTTLPAAVAFWRPITLEERADDDRELRAIGRLAPGTPPSDLEARLAVVSPELVPADEDGALTLWAEPLRSTLVRGARTPLLVLLGGAWMILLVACANVGNLLLTRGEERRRTLAIRAALGATRHRLARIQVIETALLAGAGGLVGVAAGAAVLPALVSLAPAGTPRVAEAAVDLRVLAGMLIAVAVTTLAAGLAPASGGSSVSPRDAMSRSRGRAPGSGRRAAGARRRLVTAQVALCTVLATGAALLLSTVSSLASSDPGFDPRGVVAVDLYPTPEAREAAGGGLAYDRRILDAVGRLPGVVAAGMGSHPPTDGRGLNGRIFGLAVPGGPPGAADGADVVELGGAYLEAIGMRLLAGRALGTEEDRSEPLVALVNAAFAERAMGLEPRAAVGRRVSVVDLLAGGERTDIEIVGVVGSVRPNPRVEPRPLVYVSSGQWGFGYGTLFVRVAGDPTSLLPELRTELRTLDPALPLNRVALLEDALWATRAPPSFMSRILVGFGALALLLAALGSYGVMAYGVARRAPELGLRRALGARAPDVVGLVLQEAAGIAVRGVAVGLLGAVAASGALSSILFGVRRIEPGLYGSVALVVTAATVVAAWLPARRASRVDPVAALRGE